MKKITFTIIALVVLLVVVYIGYQKFSTKEATMVACTLEAKICPDGSSVGRTGPNCEFAMCPAESATTSKSVTDISLGISYKYIDNFYEDNNLTNYVHPVEWPPKFAVATSTFSCKTSGNIVQANGKTELKTVNGNKYCLTIEAEGAAGSTYTTYTYKRQYDKKVIVLSFITRVPQCMNYDEPKASECKAEIENFSIDNLVDNIFGSVVFN